jgi:hypothetical protein
MASNVFASKAKLNSLFSDESVLYPEFLPDQLPERERF